MTDNTDKRIKLPELLAPAGSFQSLEAAIEAGADAVYMGGSLFNARINAANFNDDEMKKALLMCRTFGVKAYITLNIQIYDKEFEDAVKYAEFLYENGADALIIADIGLAYEIHRRFPDFELHASTQMSGHNTEAAEFLSSHGFSRMVCARELSETDIKTLTSNSPIEIEAFIHGAHCVSHSGQCTASFAMGGRSGNRGECAQPCRLAYTMNGKKGYPLSLRDMCLAGNIKNLIDCGISSLKIEGRMKSPEYVYGVVKIYRRLLDQSRNATAAEIKELANLFSRGGFTDGYFKNKRDESMLGIRSESDKELSRQLTPFSGLSKRVPVKIETKLISGEKAQLTVTIKSNGKCAVVYGDIPENAVNAPLSLENVKKQLSKLGGTYYSVSDDDCVIELGENIMVPVSKLNALRRDAISELDRQLLKKNSFKKSDDIFKNLHSEISEDKNKPLKKIKSARFIYDSQISEKARDYFDIVYLPFENYSPNSRVNGIILPPVIFDSQLDEIKLGNAVNSGVKYALVSNIGHISLAKKYGLECRGDFRLNVFNSVSMEFLLSSGFESIIVSPELSLRQIRDIPSSKGMIVYGKIPVMLMERCIMRSKVSGCHQNSNHDYRCMTQLIDRTSMKLPVFGTFGHRNIVYNTVPIYMADKINEINGIADEYHFIFSTETQIEADKIIEAYEKGYSLNDKIRRLK